MTRKPIRPRLALRRFHLAWWVAAIALLVPLASCTKEPEPAPKASVPATPTGSAIKAVVDVAVGDIDIGAFFGSDVAVDDISGDVFCLGRSGPMQTLYRVDPQSGARTALATLPSASAYTMNHLVATNGWVFWVEVDGESLEDSGEQILVYLAIRADGTERRELARYQAPIGSAMGEPSANSGFEAGGGTAMWLEINERGRIIHLFDTRTLKALLVKNQPKVREMGSVHGDRVVLWAVTGVQLYSIRTGQFSVIDYMQYGMVSNDAVAGWVSRSSRLTACFFTLPADPVRCDKPVAAEITEGFWPRCILGTHVAGYAERNPSEVKLINVAASGDQTSISTGPRNTRPGIFSCGGKNLIYPWSVLVREDHDLVKHTYIRVITMV